MGEVLHATTGFHDFSDNRAGGRARERGRSATAETSDSGVAPAHEELVRKLGDSSFRIRELAARQLLDIGLPAKAALLEALNSTDLETRMGAHRVLVRILQSDFDSQLEAFVEGEDGDGLLICPAGNCFPEWWATRRQHDDCSPR